MSRAASPASRALVWLGALALAAGLAAAAVLANLALLGYGTSSNDPVGKLSPRAPIGAVPAARSTVVRPRPRNRRGRTLALRRRRRQARRTRWRARPPRRGSRPSRARRFSACG